MADALTVAVMWGGGELAVNTDATGGSIAIAVTATTATASTTAATTAPPTGAAGTTSTSASPGRAGTSAVPNNGRGALRGYGFSSAVAITGNSTAATATWAGGATMAALVRPKKTKKKQ